MVQRASTDILICETDFDDSPRIITRLDEDNGCSMIGGFETCGMATACVMRSDTIWRARIRSVPGWNHRTTDERPGTDSERIDCSHGRPLSKSCSIGTVISCSTSSAESPSDSVWISTYGCENSGNTSTGICRNCETPNTMIRAAITTTRTRSCMLAPTIQRIIGDLYFR